VRTYMNISKVPTKAGKYRPRDILFPQC
jgi:hypothetical protein